MTPTVIPAIALTHLAKPILTPTVGSIQREAYDFLPSPTPAPSATPINLLSVLLDKNGYNDVVITLERTMCFGTCPVYLLTIKGNGTVIFDGHEHVKFTGQHMTTITLQQVKELVSEFEQIAYFTLPNFVDYDMTDMPSVTTSISIGETTKTVYHYYGDMDSPKELFDLERKIDEIVNSAQWIGE